MMQAVPRPRIVQDRIAGEGLLRVPNALESIHPHVVRV